MPKCIYQNEVKMPPIELEADEIWDRQWELKQAHKQALSRLTGEDVTAFRGLIRALLSSEENRAFSPTTLLCALIFLGGITDGKCQEEIFSALGCSKDTAQSLYKNICDAITGYSGLTDCTLSNSVWLNESVPLNEDKIKELCGKFTAEAFSGQMGTAQMNRAIQNWIDEHTGRMLTEESSGIETSPDGALSLVLASYFKAEWVDPFWKGQTRQGRFYLDKENKITCPFMNEKKRAMCYLADGFTAVSKQLQVGYQMWFLLPNKGRGLSDMVTAPKVAAFLANPQAHRIKEYMVTLGLPKFDVSSNLDITDAMRKLGINAVFSESAADFSPISDSKQLFLSQADHAARVSISEDGVEAAAYIDLSVAAAAIPPKVDEIKVRFDRPFLFAITKSNRVPFYVGTVVNPLE